MGNSEKIISKNENSLMDLIALLNEVVHEE